jgi:bifunctional non-homologous end joining protein LigD
MPRAAARSRPKTTLSKLPGAVRSPFPAFIPPSLATPGDRLQMRGQWVHEIKHDGYRAHAHVREGKPIPTATQRVPQCLSKPAPCTWRPNLH